MLADYDTDTTVVGQQSRFTWEEQLRALLSATPLSLPPVSILEIYKEVSDHRSVTKRPPKSSQWPLFLSLSSFNGAVHLPRLDLIVKYDQLDIMEWLFENNYARHDTVVPRPVMENDAFATRLEIVEEFPCRICLDFKQLPTSLPCNHSLCQLCFERVASRQPMTDHTICYFCGEDTMIPFHITLTLRLSYCIKKKHPWFMIHYRMPILHVLFGLAAGMDSINTFIWLIEYWKLDPRKVLFKDGDTVLHIAASRGSILVGEWLCNNNYSSLLEVQNDRGEIPLKQAIRSTKPGASVVVSLMIALHAARQPFIDLSVFFGDADISEPVMNVYRRIVDLENAKEPRRMFEENQDAESILCRVSFAPEYWGDQCPIEGFINLILEFRRCDVFRMMFRGPTCIIFSKMTQRKRHDLFKKVKVSGTSNMNADALTVKKLFQIEIDIKKVSKKFHSLISGNSELEAVITAYHHHRHLVAKIKTVDPNGVFAIIRHACSAPKDFLGTETKMEQSGFELAIRSDRIDVAKWLLDEVVSSERDLDDIIHPSTLFFQDQKFLCLKRSVLVVQLCKHLSVGYFSKVLHEFIVMFFHQHNSIELLFLEGHIEYLSNVPGVDINYLDENGETAVFELGRVFRSHNAGPRGESFLGIIKVLVENGLDLNIVSFKQRCTLLEVLLKEGVNEVTWPTVFWLANEKWLDVSYHYVVFSGSEENVICMRDQFNWVKIIQERSIEAAKGAVACLTFP
ncbi:hypothetical protein BC829DRAFT_384680 [Chytridium lagenaria]|nr:hypothetical protein BC829DRAFT_384680 [Chytridium lagenaria]